MNAVSSLSLNPAMHEVDITLVVAVELRDIETHKNRLVDTPEQQRRVKIRSQQQRRDPFLDQGAFRRVSGVSAMQCSCQSRPRICGETGPQGYEQKTQLYYVIYPRSRRQLAGNVFTKA